jgi:hypothetical protein
VTGSAGATESSWSVVWIRGTCPFSARVLVLFVIEASGARFRLLA